MKKLLAVLALLLWGIFAVSYSWAGEVRVWTSGGFTVKGEFVELTEDGTVIRIRKTNSNVVRIPLAKLSEDDVAYVNEMQNSFVEEKSPFEEEDSPSSALQAGTRKVMTVDGIEYAFRWCPPGEFMMGAEPIYETRSIKIKRTWGEWAAGKPDTKTERYVTNTNQLQHKVKITKGFWLMETEVTQAMWQSVMGVNPSEFKGDRNPVEQVSWDDSQSFCQKLSQKLGQQVKLPTEAQWEYACRAGTTGAFAGTLDEIAWYVSNSGSTTHAVGQKNPNAWGLCDMHGNVFEWCSDYYDDEYYSRSPTSDPENTTASPYHVFRGGAWGSSAGFCRSALRDRCTPDYRYSYLGLRLLVVPSPED